jgi:UDPglucose 6-dehydrogenase
MRLTVIGTGYLGAVHAACMAEIGHDVLGVDTDAERAGLLARGRAPFFEPGFDDLLKRAVTTGRLSFGTSLAEAADFADVHFICVGTPQHADSHAADISGIRAVVDGLVPLLRRDALLAGKSTVPVGTAAAIAGRAATLTAPGVRVEVAWNPEFLREGTAVEDTLRPDRLVVGAASPKSDAALRSVYEPLIAAGTPYIATDPSTAELVKVSANAFLATKVSFINAIADVCEASGADIVTLARALGHDSRIGGRYLSAGLGFGGSCLAKDIRAFVARAEELGAGDSMSFLREVDQYNLRRRQRAVELAAELVGGSLDGCNVAVLGAAFKPDTDDVRDSPALQVAAEIQRRGALVRVHDPRASENARALEPSLDYAPTPQKACVAADLVLHLTEWSEYGDIDPAELGRIVRHRRILDARNTLPPERWQAAGWLVRGLGRVVN